MSFRDRGAKTYTFRSEVLVTQEVDSVYTTGWIIKYFITYFKKSKM